MSAGWGGPGEPRESVRVERAYAHCESLTRAAAANFYYGIRLLPREKRAAICAVYAFARRVDDIGDGHIEPGEKFGLLDAATQSLQHLSTDSSDLVLVALADSRWRFTLPVESLLDLIAGVRMDVEGATYESFDDLLVYCRRVAGSIGRLCLAIFGAREYKRAAALADDLGVAMQLTNILRDLQEDAEHGRVYLPREDLVRYSLSTDGRYEGEEGQLDAFTRFQVHRADEWFEQGIELVGLLDRRSAACVLAMSGIYRRVLERIRRDPERARASRASLPAWEKAWVAARSLARG
ncbi:MAG TPA: presqualene diphosphate synthase HpnD [Solirubrobacteraceae bacterium]|nr:presqualene diphosphate synthase HpnD [Solirubrobacteraceae bacterium]